MILFVLLYFHLNGILQIALLCLKLRLHQLHVSKPNYVQVFVI